MISTRLYGVFIQSEKKEQKEVSHMHCWHLVLIKLQPLKCSSETIWISDDVIYQKCSKVTPLNNIVSQKRK